MPKARLHQNQLVAGCHMHLINQVRRSKSRSILPTFKSFSFHSKAFYAPVMKNWSVKWSHWNITWNIDHATSGVSMSSLDIHPCLNLPRVWISFIFECSNVFSGHPFDSSWSYPHRWYLIIMKNQDYKKSPPILNWSAKRGVIETSHAACNRCSNVFSRHPSIFESLPI